MRYSYLIPGMTDQRARRQDTYITDIVRSKDPIYVYCFGPVFNDPRFYDMSKREDKNPIEPVNLFPRAKPEVPE